MEQNGKQFLQSLSVLFYSLLGGQLLVGLVLYFFFPPVPEAGPDDVFQFVLPVVLVSCIGLSLLLAPKRIAMAKEAQTLEAKLLGYRSAWVMRWALVEGGTLLCLVGYFFVSGNILFLVMAGVGIVFFGTQLPPSSDRLVSDLALSSQERSRLEDPNEIVVVVRR
ncbi:MAG: hypothetical protein IPL65_07520 [Lewinellaceae bacterium]|nr:hypothetical protein [Lewinellaceae bacterium]